MLRALVRLLSLAALALPAVNAMEAAADTPARQGTTRALARFEVKGPTGHTVFVEASGPQVRLTVHHANSFARYWVRGFTSTGGVKARFGDLGRISVRFEPRSRVKMVWPPKECYGYPEPGWRGVFRGTIEFRGEGGYVKLDASRAEGLVTSSSSSRWNCGSGKGYLSRASASELESEEEEVGPYVNLVAETPGSRRWFTAISAPGESSSPYSYFRALAAERRGSIRIHRETFMTGPVQGFFFDSGLSSAIVQPPEPFQGSATFQREPDGSKAWFGSLSVSFLGREDVALAGPRFDARLFPATPGGD